MQEVGVSRGQKAVLKQWQISMEPKKKAKVASLHSDPVCADKPSTSTADVTITEDEVTSLMSAVAGISMADGTKDGTKDTMDKHSKFLAVISRLSKFFGFFNTSTKILKGQEILKHSRS